MTNNFGNIQVEVQEGVGGRTRDVLEQCVTTWRKATGIKAKNRSRARKEASAQEVRGYYNQFAEAKHLEYKSWVESQTEKLCDWKMGAHNQDGQTRYLPQSKSNMDTERFPRQTEGISTD